MKFRMSYRGRPSKGCEGCRTRKVKCDEMKPICSRCNRSGHECKYRDPADLLFKNQTASAAQRAEESWRKRSKSHTRARSDSIVQTTVVPGDGTTSLRNRSRTAERKSPNRPYGLTNPAVQHAGSVMVEDVSNQDAYALYIGPSSTPDLCRLAYERFVYDFVSPESPNRPLEEPSDALFTFIPILYRNASPNSCIAAVVNAVSYINFANRCNAPEAALLAEESIGKGIKMLYKMIADSEQAASNNALCATYLMTVYDNLTSIERRQSTFKAHQHGANALLQLRTLDQYYSNPISMQLYELIFWQQLLGNLHLGESPPIPVENILNVRLRSQPSLYNDSNILVTKLIWREAVLHARWQGMKQSTNPPESRHDLQQLLHECLALDADYQTWETTIPLVWRYQMQPNSPESRSTYEPKWKRLALESSGAPEEIHSYANIKRCWVWAFHRTSRMYLLRDILEILNWMFRLPEHDIALNQTMVNLLEDNTKPNRSSDNALPVGLDNRSLRIQHAFTTGHMVTTIEKSCSAVLGSFTVPIHGKSFEDVVGMRGYVVVWSMGIMDSILSSGLVPDSNAPLSPPETCCSSPQAQATLHVTALASPQHLIQPFFHDLTSPEQSYTTSFSVPPEAHSPTPISPRSNHRKPTPIFDASTPRAHVFDVAPKHPFDHPIDLPTLNLDITTHKSIDVAARRVWLNRMLYYIGSELGIKKALAVPFMEGYLNIVQPDVDAIFGR